MLATPAISSLHSLFTGQTTPTPQITLLLIIACIITGLGRLIWGKISETFKLDVFLLAFIEAIAFGFVSRLRKPK